MNAILIAAIVWMLLGSIFLIVPFIVIAWRNRPVNRGATPVGMSGDAPTGEARTTKVRQVVATTGVSAAGTTGAAAPGAAVPRAGSGAVAPAAAATGAVATEAAGVATERWLDGGVVVDRGSR
jgi:hypothetical protein